MQRLLTLICFCAALRLSAQVSFEVHAPQRVAAGEEFYVEYVLSNAEGSDFKVGSFAPFSVLGGPSVGRSTSIQFVNGRRSSSSTRSYTYALMADKAGTFRLPAATIHADGHVYKTRAASIAVGGGAASASPGAYGQPAPSQSASAAGQGSASLSKGDLRFFPVVTKRTVYEQEPILLTYNFDVSVRAGLRNVSHQKPDMTGFWTQEISGTNNISPSVERRGGELREVGTYLKYLLFPQQTGKLTIPSVVFNCEVRPRGAEVDVFDAFFNGAGRINPVVQRRSEPLTIEVLPLPAPRPAAFSGGVGSFDVHTQILTPEIKTNDVATLRLTISGRGNMKLIKAPVVRFPKSFESYEARMTDKTRVTADGLSGEMFFDYTFVPRNVGQYDIPAAEFVYFDTQRREYVTLHTQPIHLNVLKGERSAEDVEAELAMLGSDIRDIHRDEMRVHHTTGWGGRNWIGTWGFFLQFFCELTMLWNAFVAVRKRFERNADVEGVRKRRAKKKANKHLAAAEKALDGGSHDEFYSALAQALRGYFADHLSRDAAALTNDVILAELAQRGLDADAVAQTKSLLEECDFARFAPAADASQREQHLEQASQLINLIESNLKQQ